MTKDEIRKTVEQRVGEFFDSYLIVGRIAGRQECVILCEVPDSSSRQQLCLAITNVVSSDQFKGK